MPAQHGVRADQKLQAAQELARQRGKQRGQESPVGRGELHLAGTELPLKDGELMAQGEDLRVLVAIAHRQQPQGGESVRDSQVCQAKQHE